MADKPPRGIDFLSAALILGGTATTLATPLLFGEFLERGAIGAAAWIGLITYSLISILTGKWLYRGIKRGWHTTLGLLIFGFAVSLTTHYYGYPGSLLAAAAAVIAAAYVYSQKDFFTEEA